MCQLSQPTIRPHNQMGPPRFNKNKLLLTSNQPPSLPSAGFLVFYDHRPPVLEIITTTSRCNHQSAPKRCIFLQLSEQSRLAKGNVQAPNKPEILMLNPPRASKKPRRHDRGPPLKIAALLRLNGALKKTPLGAAPGAPCRPEIFRLCLEKLSRPGDTYRFQQMVPQNAWFIKIIKENPNLK